uniref:Predicted protein n=1 Tax=Hordeum vulgare subsp. vulgare TaxID=112509 RepID=F2D675_HORVV|nr:predicted protein [Hordeum vulgare subsp. vulgare]
MAAAAAAAGAASSLAPSTSQRRLPFRPIPTRQPLLPIPNKALTLSPKRPRLLHPIAASSPSPPPPEDAEPTDPVKLAFARAAAYKKDRANPTPKPPPPPPPPSPPPPPQPSAKESVGSKEAFERALEYRNGNGGGLDAGSALLNPSPPFGQSTFTNKEGAFGKMAKKKGGYAYDETDFLGLGFFEKKRYQGPPPGLSQGIDPFSNEDFPEVEIVIGDPSKFGKSRRSTENQPVDDSESEETSRSKSSKQNEDGKVEETPLSTVIEPEDDENSESYKPRVTTWGMFPRPQNISKAYGGGRNISLGGETQSAEEKAAKDKRTRELLAAYIGGKNKTLDAKTKAECTKALKEGDELMNAGRLKQALPYYEKVMQAADFKTELHGMAALQWSICLDSLCRSKEAMGMYSKLKYHPNDRVSKKAKMFMFSFQAADFLEVDGVPVPRNTGYEGYFDQFGGQRNYYANPDEPEVGIGQIVPYMVFLVSPIFFVAFIALRKSLML